MPIVHGFGHGVIHQGPPLLGSFSPTSYNPALWLDASDQSTLYQERTGASATTLVSADADPVGTWRDKSGNARHVTAASDAARPTYKVNQLNGKSTLLGDGTDDCLSIADPFYSSDWTVFVVSKTNAYNASATQRILSKFGGVNADRELIFYYGVTDSVVSGKHDGTNFDTTPTLASIGTGYNVLSFQKSGVAATVAKNGTTSNYTYNNSTVQNTSSDLQLFGNFNAETARCLNGNIAEIIFYTSVLSTSQRQQVERYLAAKWGITLS